MTAKALVRGLTVVVGTAALAYLVMLGTVTVRWAGDFERFLMLAVLGGVVIAVMRLLLTNRNRTPFVTDPFATGTGDIVNVSRIRVAGLGGAGLVLAAFAVALQYPLTTIAMSAGIIGGVLMAVAMIISRRRKPA
jgi:hypothetical protein